MKKLAIIAFGLFIGKNAMGMDNKTLGNEGFNYSKILINDISRLSNDDFRAFNSTVGLHTLYLATLTKATHSFYKVVVHGKGTKLSHLACLMCGGLASCLCGYSRQKTLKRVPPLNKVYKSNTH